MCRNVDCVAAAAAGTTVSSSLGEASLATGLFKVGMIDPSRGGAVFKRAVDAGTLGAFTKNAFTQAAQVPFNLMFFALYDCFLAINPKPGITMMEF